MSSSFQGIPKYIIGWIVVFVIRLIPFRAPNIEPVMATLMPFSKRYGMFGAFIFGSLSIALFDLAVGKVGQWTAITAIAYGAVGVGSGIYFRKRESNRKNYLIFAVFGTLFYDAVTGLSIGPLFFSQPFGEAFIGQISFTLWHLAGNILFALIISPVLYQWVVTNRRFEFNKIIEILNSKTSSQNI
ncbi:MAG: hypothetical protein A3C07_05135 [Candidatus Sungbacteria bacterium RIFCSPHIGHO2_02_FULL_47_11]|uniref:Rod shape-determining protein MreD n=1 Tax=Candidatus Sungbacteria bacterium RIFCSPHIGHO2_02_FULL_47_11 TaxID=1802270 RepID=A0A1G2KQU9_9BACT|nr:MAG: hypothetical protein A3C07_05135 [Candidatus Sungbacteria bacterium RIFCSPHIGHO2_02_FULL_47_11]